MKLQQVFNSESIILNLESESKEELFEELLQNIVRRFPEIDRNEAIDALWKREQEMNTNVLPGYAVPHCVVDTLKGVAGAIGFSKKGIDFESEDGKPVHCIFMIISPSGYDSVHLEMLKGIATLLTNSSLVSRLNSASAVTEVCDIISECEKYFDS